MPTNPPAPSPDSASAKLPYALPLRCVHQGSVCPGAILDGNSTVVADCESRKYAAALVAAANAMPAYEAAREALNHIALLADVGLDVNTQAMRDWPKLFQQIRAKARTALTPETGKAAK